MSDYCKVNFKDGHSEQATLLSARKKENGLPVIIFQIGNRLYKYEEKRENENDTTYSDYKFCCPPSWCFMCINDYGEPVIAENIDSIEIEEKKI